jgi:4'-phosphopantetheinyl transferase
METLAPGQAGAVRVWLEWIDAAVEPEALEILDDDERARAGRFRFERDRRRFVARRAFLRRTLAGYVGLEPARLRYRSSATGKPELVGADVPAFSSSHADGLAIVAVTIEGEVGVDVERLRPVPDALDVARSFFTAGEQERLRSLPASQRSAAFLLLWTAKEACVKLLGRGLSMPLDDFEILDHGGVAKLVGSGELGSTRLWSVDVPAGYVATVAAPGTSFQAQQAPQLAIAS